MKLVPVNQFYHTYTTIEGEEITLVRGLSVQCPQCLCMLGTPRTEDGKYVDLEWPCPHCERQKETRDALSKLQ